MQNPFTFTYFYYPLIPLTFSSLIAIPQKMLYNTHIPPEKNQTNFCYFRGEYEVFLTFFEALQSYVNSLDPALLATEALKEDGNMGTNWLRSNYLLANPCSKLPKSLPK